MSNVPDYTALCFECGKEMRIIRQVIPPPGATKPMYVFRCPDGHESVREIEARAEFVESEDKP